MVLKDKTKIEQAWETIAEILFVPHTEAQYHHLVSVLDSLIDLVREDETHPLASLMDVMGSLIEQYENENVPKLSDIYEFPTDEEDFPITSDVQIQDTILIGVKEFPYPPLRVISNQRKYDVDTFSSGTATISLNHERIS